MGHRFNHNQCPSRGESNSTESNGTTEDLRRLIDETKKISKRIVGTDKLKPGKSNHSHMLASALEATMNVLKYLRDEIPTTSSDAPGKKKSMSSVGSLLCVCPCCRKNFPSPKILEKDQWGKTTKEGRRKNAIEKSWRDKWRECQKNVDGELKSHSVPKLRKAIESLTKTEEALSWNKGQPASRDNKKRQFMALYEDLVHEKCELEMTTKLQQRIEELCAENKCLEKNKGLRTKLGLSNHRNLHHGKARPKEQGKSLSDGDTPKRDIVLDQRTQGEDSADSVCSECCPKCNPELQFSVECSACQCPKCKQLYAKANTNAAALPCSLNVPPSSPYVHCPVDACKSHTHHPLYKGHARTPRSTAGATGVPPPETYPLIVPDMMVPDDRHYHHHHQRNGKQRMVPLDSPRVANISLYANLRRGEKMYPGFKYGGKDYVPGFTPSSVRSGINTPIF